MYALRVALIHGSAVSPRNLEELPGGHPGTQEISAAAPPSADS